jgi:hypothetical protein
MHKNPTKIARKRHENHTSYNKEIDATMKASIHSEVRFFTKPVKNLNLWSMEMTLREKLALVTGNAPVTDQVIQISQER